MLAIFVEPPHGVLFVERADHLRSHPGQIGLPGGGEDPADGGDLQRTALRELHEEVGIEAERVTFIGRLPRLRSRANHYDVTPFVASVAPGPLRLDGEETVGAFSVPLATVVSEELHEDTIEFGAFQIRTPLLDYQGHRIWGLTGHILQSFSARWHDPGDDLRAAIERLLVE